MVKREKQQQKEGVILAETMLSSDWQAKGYITCQM
jgi:hypothetical protein